jgi:dihydroorotate dehydrogenase
MMAGGTLTKLLQFLPPEAAHRIAIRGLAAGGGRVLGRVTLDPALATPDLVTTIAGVTFANPIGLAAGFDKNAEAAGPLLDLGFGSVEVGTVTPRPQAGNPKPRLFRLDADQAIINRMGFNNDGADAVAARLEGLRNKRPSLPGPVGVNLGCNRDSEDAIADYRFGVHRFVDLADYLVINISSPNTPGLRGLQAADVLRRLLDAVTGARDAAGRRVPIFVKIAPDLDDQGIDAMVAPLLESGIDGVLATNTTTYRPDSLQSPYRTEAGGLSGQPLAILSGKVQARLVGALGTRLPVIAVGGISSGLEAYDRIANGAAAVQIYSSFVLQGPGMIRTALADLSAALKAGGAECVADAVGSRWPAVNAA